MRRFLSFCFATLILFNTVGYVYVLGWYQNELERKAEELIDAHISEISGNLIFTVPVTIPYPPSMSEYTRIDGEITFEGSAYRMVKQKLQGNLLYIVCLKDDRTRIATDQINEVIAAVSGQSAKESTTNESNAFNSLLKYCEMSMASNNSNSDGWVRKFAFADREEMYRYNSARVLFRPPTII